MPNKELTHYGIPGMRWGVRRSKAQLARARGSGTRRRVTKEEYDKAKKDAINSGDTKRVRAWKDHLTEAEFREALNRVDLNQRLSTAEAKGKKSGLDAVENVMNKIGRVTNIVNTGLNAYGVVAKINNTFNPKQLPSIDGTNVKEKAAKKAEEAAKKERVAKDTESLYKLIKDDKIDEMYKNMDSYEPEAIKEVAQVLNNLSNVDKKRKKKDSTEDDRDD